jgi:hypothetical protein
MRKADKALGLTPGGRLLRDVDRVGPFLLAGEAVYKWAGSAICAQECLSAESVMSGYK